MENSTTKSKWYDKNWLVYVLCIVFFPVGFYGLYKNSSISQGWKVGITITISLIVIAQLCNKERGSSTTSNSISVQTEEKSDKPNVIGLNQVLHTEYFDVRVNRVSIHDRVKTGNPFADLKPEEGNMYLIINTSFKNTDKESRMLIDGSVWITYNNKEYEFDKSETIMLEGWGLLLDQINPLTTKTTNLVYKIPAEIKGPAYWQPGRSENSQRIFLGEL